MIKSLRKLLIAIALVGASICSQAQQLPVITNDLYSVFAPRLTEGERQLFINGLMEIAKGFGNAPTNFARGSTNLVMDGSNHYSRAYVELTNVGPHFLQATNSVAGKRMSLIVWSSRTNAIINLASAGLRPLGTNITSIASNTFAMFHFDMNDGNVSNVTVTAAGQQ